MLINEKIKIKINNHSVKHYLSLGYDAKCRKELIINSKDLSKSSRYLVLCECDVCKKPKRIKFQDYKKIIDKGKGYKCEKCKIINIKQTKLKKYGNENYNNIDKIAKTMIEKYGCSSALQNKDLMMKKEKTCLKKYGTKTASRNDKIRKKIKDSNNNNFKDIELKKRIIEKRKKTSKKLYGKEHFTQTIQYKLKSEKTCLKKYGYRHNGSVPELINKRQNTRRKNDNKNHNEFNLYKKKVINITYKFLKSLFLNWNGIDFYDNEYIAENLNLIHTDRLYPTVDHKISINYGYKNKLSPIIIGDNSNLCITKKHINSSKGDKCYF